MKKVLHHIRKQPEHVKTRYVIIFAVLATALIIVIWLITMRMIKMNDDTIKTESPFSIFKEVFKGSVSDMKKTLPQKSESLDETLGTIPSDSSTEVTQTESSETNSPVQPADTLPAPVQ